MEINRESGHRIREHREIVVNDPGSRSLCRNGCKVKRKSLVQTRFRAEDL